VIRKPGAASGAGQVPALSGWVPPPAVATALCAALGVGVGTVIRNQVGAIIAVLGLLYVAEPLLEFVPGADTAVQKFGLGGLAKVAIARSACACRWRPE